MAMVAVVKHTQSVPQIFEARAHTHSVTCSQSACGCSLPCLWHTEHAHSVPSASYSCFVGADGPALDPLRGVRRRFGRLGNLCCHCGSVPGACGTAGAGTFSRASTFAASSGTNCHAVALCAESATAYAVSAERTLPARSTHLFVTANAWRRNKRSRQTQAANYVRRWSAARRPDPRRALGCERRRGGGSTTHARTDTRTAASARQPSKGSATAAE